MTVTGVTGVATPRFCPGRLPSVSMRENTLHLPQAEVLRWLATFAAHRAATQAVNSYAAFF